VEGETDDAAILELRARQQRNFLTTLFVSQGTPMLLGGDELDRTQGGNNNAWCQDSEVSWYDWYFSPRAERLRDFTRRLIRLRHEHPVFRRTAFLRGQELKGSGLPDVWWFRADGLKMTRRDWNSGESVLGLFLNGREIATPGPHGEDIEDDSFFVLFNAHSEDRAFTLPRRRFGAMWTLELSTADPEAERRASQYGARTEVPVTAHSIVILKRLR
jgi:glycogen operon protein